MTNEERIAGLEHAVIRLSNIWELKFGAYALDVNPAVRSEGEQIRGWAGSVQEHRAGT
jgi:hypothetical protein